MGGKRGLSCTGDRELVDRRWETAPLPQHQLQAAPGFSIIPEHSLAEEKGSKPLPKVTLLASHLTAVTIVRAPGFLFEWSQKFLWLEETTGAPIQLSG